MRASGLASMTNDFTNKLVKKDTYVTVDLVPYWEYEDHSAYKRVVTKRDPRLSREKPHSDANEARKYLLKCPQGEELVTESGHHFLSEAKNARMHFGNVVPDESALTKYFDEKGVTLPGNSAEVAKVLITGKGRLRMTCYTLLADSLDEVSGSSSTEDAPVAKKRKSSGPAQSTKPTEAPPAEYDEEERLRFRELQEAHQKDLNKLQEVHIARLEKEKEEEARKAALQAASKAKLLELRKTITPRTWEVTAHDGTNLEQQTCTNPLLDRLFEMGAWKTHDVPKEFELRVENGKRPLRVDVALVAFNPSTHCDIRIECKVKNFNEARGQCRSYQELELRPEAQTHVYAYFPEELKESWKLNGLKRDGTGVLWPGQERTIQLERA